MKKSTFSGGGQEDESSPCSTRVMYERLIHSTVHNVLFKPSSNRPNTSEGPRILQEEKQNHYAFVMNHYANWTVDALKQEKRALKRYLKAQAKAEEAPELDQDDAEALARKRQLQEAYALLKLFLYERQAGKQIGKRELHVQLLLYAQYFQHVHARQIESLQDLVPIHTMYTQLQNV